MATDYHSNAHKNKSADAAEKSEKRVEKVVAGDVVVQKKTVGRRFKDLFAKADLRNASQHVIYDVLIPAARNVLVDGVTRGIEWIAYGDRAVRQRNYGPGPRYTMYNSPVTRGYSRSMPGPSAPPVGRAPRQQPRHGGDDYILTSREDAELVLERMNDVIEKYDVASVADLHELIGIPASHVDNKWGWIDLTDVLVRQVREGWLIDFPPAEPIS